MAYMCAEPTHFDYRRVSWPVAPEVNLHDTGEPDLDTYDTCSGRSEGVNNRNPMGDQAEPDEDDDPLAGKPEGYDPWAEPEDTSKNDDDGHMIDCQRCGKRHDSWYECTTDV